MVEQKNRVANFNLLYFFTSKQPYNMANTSNIVELHLRYRIWIAEMNADVSILRIFDDYLESISSSEKQTTLLVKKFKDQFLSLRQQMDCLKHEMHLKKMKLAAMARDGKLYSNKSIKEDNHAGCKKQYVDYRKIFNQMKTEFGITKFG